MAYYPAAKIASYNDPYSPDQIENYSQKASQSKLSQGAALQGCPNPFKDADLGLSSEANQLADLSSSLVTLVDAVRGHLDPNFGMIGQAQSNACPAPPTQHLRYQLSTAIGNTNHTIEQLRFILDIVSR